MIPAAFFLMALVAITAKSQDSVRVRNDLDQYLMITLRGPLIPDPGVQVIVQPKGTGIVPFRKSWTAPIFGVRFQTPFRGPLQMDVQSCSDVSRAALSFPAAWMMDPRYAGSSYIKAIELRQGIPEGELIKRIEDIRRFNKEGGVIPTPPPTQPVSVGPTLLEREQDLAVARKQLEQLRDQYLEEDRQEKLRPSSRVVGEDTERKQRHLDTGRAIEELRLRLQLYEDELKKQREAEAAAKMRAIFGSPQTQSAKTSGGKLIYAGSSPLAGRWQDRDKEAKAWLKYAARATKFDELICENKKLINGVLIPFDFYGETWYSLTYDVLQNGWYVNNRPDLVPAIRY